MCDFREHATSAPAELGAEIHNVSRNRARTQVGPSAGTEVARLRKWHVWCALEQAAPCFGLLRLALHALVKHLAAVSFS